MLAPPFVFHSLSSTSVVCCAITNTEGMSLFLKLSGSRLCKTCAITLPKQIVRNLSFIENLVSKQDVNVLVDKDRHDLIYKYTYIKHIAALYRMKLIFPASALATSPVFLLPDSTGKLTLCAISVGVLQFIFLSFVSKLFSNIVGLIYIDKKAVPSEVIICSLNSFGGRIETKHSTKDLILIGAEHKLNEILGYMTIKVDNSDKKYLLNFKYFKSDDEEALKTSLGDLKYYS